MNANDIKIGTKFEIDIPDYNNKISNSATSYISQLIDVIDRKTISIVAPMSEGRLKFLSNGLSIIIYYQNDRQDLLSFKATVKNHKKTGPLEVFDLTIESDFTKIQRRRFFRLDIGLSCQFAIIAKELLSNEKLVFTEIAGENLKNANTKNLSESGLCLILDTPLDPGSIVDITIDLEEMAIIRVFAQVIRSIHAESKKYEVGMHFININSHDSAILTKFIFEKQRIILRNTLRAGNK